MAGNYPDYPSWRFAYDQDGTQIFKFHSPDGQIEQLTSTDAVIMNNESDDDVTIRGFSTSEWDRGLAFLFPELRDLDGWFLSNDIGASGNNSRLRVQVSTDTTNGQDGTWTSVADLSSYDQPEVTPSYRTGINSTTSLAIRGVRFLTGKDESAGGSNTEFTVKALHLFGEPAPGENPQRLALWHPTSDARVGPAYFDWGNTPRSSTNDIQFRVKNLDASATANDVRVAFDVLTDATPSVPGQHMLSEDGTTFLAQIDIGDLGPGVISPVLTLRRVTPSNAQLGVWAFRVFAEQTGGWS